MHTTLLRTGLCLVLLAPAGCRPASAQPVDGGARAAALAGATTAFDEDAWGHANPAAWAAVPRRLVAFFASEGFGMRELRLGAARYVETLRFGTVAAGAQTFGFDDYRETRLSAGFARGLHLGSARRLLAAVRLSYERDSIAGDGRAAAVGVSAGGLVEVRPSLLFGFSAVNLNLPRWGPGEELPRSLALGLCYRPEPRLAVLADVYKEMRFPATVRAGVEAVPVDPLALRAGVATAPVRFTAGAGLRLAPLSIDLAAARHEVLGWTPAVALTLLW